ncbi:MAG: amidase [Dehalococcoidia bacterium]|nr:amidase [Dehalococcoidia bacterium]
MRPPDRLTTSTQLPLLPLVEVSNLIHLGRVSSREVTEILLDRIDRVNPKVHAFISVQDEPALRVADAMDALLRAGHDLGPLHGVPMAVKDLFATKGALTTAGSKILGDWTPNEDATAVARLRSAGAVIVGKTNMDEFAFGGTTENAHHGTTHNPWDLERSAGGSSGGSGAATSASLAYATLGTDTAASIRNPAHFCGITGFKPTYGRVSRFGVVPLAWSLDHVGPLARSVEDAAVVLKAIAGHDPRDSSSSGKPVADYRAELDAPLGNLRVAALRGYFWDPIDPEVARIVEDSFAVIRGFGAEVVDIELPHADRFPAMQNTVLPAEASAYHLKWMQDRPGDYSPMIFERLVQGAAVRAVDLVNAERARRLTQSTVEEFMRSFDVLITPTVPYTAALLGQPMVRLGSVEIEASAARTRNLFPFNALGLPAMSIPCGFDSRGLPVGLQIVGRAFEDSTVLRVGHAYQMSTDWHRRIPPEPA